MKSLYETARESRRAAQLAAHGRHVPVLIEPEDVAAYLNGDASAIRIPHLGGYTPRGYRKIGEPLFVDSTGFGYESEPAMPLRRFLVQHVKPAASYWAVVEAGDFQVYVQRFERVR